MFNLKQKKSADSSGVALSSLSITQNKLPSHDENSKLVKKQSETSYVSFPYKFYKLDNWILIG